MGVIAKGILRGCQGLFTPVFLGYPLSVFYQFSIKKLYSQVGDIFTETGNININILKQHVFPNVS